MMKKRMNIMSKDVFEYSMITNGIDDNTVESYNDCVFISIVSYCDTPYFSRNHYNVLNLVFNDITDVEYDKMSRKDTESVILFNEELAKSIREFVDSNKSMMNWYVHCTAGISRSGAVGLWTARRLEDFDQSHFYRVNSQIVPNYFVVGLLNKEVEIYPNGKGTVC